MILIRFSLLLAIYSISCCHSLRLNQSPSVLPDKSYNASHSRSQPDSALKITSFEQKVTHFDEADTRTWNQKYRQNDKYYKKGGPAYLWIDGADIPLAIRVMKGYWVAHAKKHNAMLFSLSHRLHFFSSITKNTSLESLTYLNVSQVLSDCAEFIKGMNKLHEFPENTKWIVFGASYGGNLAAWMRQKYPKLVHGAVASSAPVLAKMEFTEYLDNVESSIESFNKKCRKDIALANEKLDELVQTENGREEIKRTFKLCDFLDGTSLSTSVFMDDMTTYIADEVMTDWDNIKLKKSCDIMMKNADSKTPVQRYAKLMDNYLKETRTKCIASNFDVLVDSLKKIDLFSSLQSGRSWLYQMCTEFGWFQISSKKSTTFSKNINSEFYIQLCSKAFKPSFDKKFISQSVDKTNKLYGGQKLNTERTLFVYGSNDPWRNLGITSSKNNKNVEIIRVKGGTHATDSSYEYMDSEHKGRKDAVKKIMAKLDFWLKK